MFLQFMGQSMAIFYLMKNLKITISLEQFWYFLEYTWRKKIMLKKFRNNLFSFLQIIIAVYLLVLVFLYFYQRNLLYHPNENNYSNDQISVSIEKVKISTSDNIDLLGWYHEKDLKKYKTILYFHGNAGSLENRIHKLNHFSEMDVNFLIIAWRGFSGNQGKPSEKGLYEDGRSGINWLISKGVKEENIVIYGESLGTGVATHLSQKKKFCCCYIRDSFYFYGRCS